MADSQIPQSLVDFIDRNKINLDEVTPDQLRNGIKIVNAANKYQLNPDFPLSMAWQESKFQSNAKNPESTAFGPMQLIDATAKGLNVDSKDVDQNIDGGMRLIKELMANKRIGNDPNKVLAGYFSGPSSKFLDTGVIEDLTPSEAKHFNAVFQFVGQDELPSLTAAEEDVGRVPALPSEGKPLIAEDSSEEDGTPNFFEIPRPIAATAGAGLGAVAGTAAGVGKAKIDAAREIYGAAKNKMFPTPDVGADTPGGKWGAKTGYGMGEGTVQESSSRYQRATPKGKVSGKLAKTWGTALPGEDPQLVQRMIDRAKAADLAKVAQEAELANKGSPFWAYLRKLGAMPVKGALIGGGLGLGGADAYNRYQEGDKTGSALAAGATALGTAVPMLAPLAAAGMALYDDPEKRTKFIEAMQPGGRWQQRMDSRFGLD